MRELKVYLDTSVVSYLQQEDAPERMADTLQLWRIFRQGKHEVILSTVTLQELQNCAEPKRTILMDFLTQIDYKIVNITPEAAAIAQKILDMGILTEKSRDDCRHIGAAVANGCDCILSWNFKHIVNVRTIRGVRAITTLEGYPPIEIWNPSVLLGSEDEI